MKWKNCRQSNTEGHALHINQTSICVLIGARITYGKYKSNNRSTETVAADRKTELSVCRERCCISLVISDLHTGHLSTHSSLISIILWLLLLEHIAGRTVIRSKQKKKKKSYKLMGNNLSLSVKQQRIVTMVNCSMITWLTVQVSGILSLSITVCINIFVSV